MPLETNYMLLFNLCENNKTLVHVLLDISENICNVYHFYATV